MPSPFPLHTVVFLLPFGIGNNRFLFGFPAGQRAVPWIVPPQQGAGVILARILGKYANLARILPGFGKLLDPLPRNLVHDMPRAIVGLGFVTPIRIVHRERVQFFP